MEKKDIKDYLHLYLGVKCNVEGIEKYGWYRLSPTVLESAEKGDITVKPMLRPLSSMTDDEIDEVCENVHAYNNSFNVEDWPREDIRDAYVELWDKYTPEEFQWLLSKGFDLFDLIESGLAIDSTLKPV